MKGVDIQAHQLGVDNTYKFEGYRIFQLANATVSVQELGDDKGARSGIRDVKMASRKYTIGQHNLIYHSRWTCSVYSREKVERSRQWDQIFQE